MSALKMLLLLLLAIAVGNEDKLVVALLVHEIVMTVVGRGPMLYTGMTCATLWYFITRHFVEVAPRE